MSWRAAKFIVVDLETTGLDPVNDEIISFAAIPVCSGRVQPGGLVSTLLRPQHAPPPEGIRVHGLRERDLQGHPTVEQRLDLISDALTDAILVAHCAWIETRFLTAALAPHGRGFEGPVIDTMVLGAAVFDRAGISCPDAPSLGYLARSLGLPVHRPHHADGDALTTAQVFLALASHLRRDQDATVGELARAHRHKRLRDRLPGIPSRTQFKVKGRPSAPRDSKR